MRILIVGCGYVGRALGAELAREGHEVFGLRRSRAGEAELRSEGIEPVYADITRPADLEGLPGPFDWVVNCAAASGGDVQDYRAVYLEGTRHLIGWLRGSPVRRYVYTSSTGVYGQTDGSWVTEESSTEPGTPTGAVLVATEQTLRAAVLEWNFPAVILRLAGIYGPGRGYWLRQFLAGEARIEGAGERFLNMIHRDDVVGVIRAALERGRAGAVYNAVDNEPVTQAEVFGWLATTTRRPLPPTTREEAQAARRRGVTNKRVSNHRLRTELGYPFRFSTFREGYAAELARLGLGATRAV